MRQKLFTLITAAFLALSISTLAKAGTWIDVDELQTSTDAIIVDARSQQDYLAGHIPGAVNAPWQSLSDMSGKPGDPDWGVVLAPEQLAEAIGKLGISNDSRVIVYSSSPSGWGEDGRVAWTLMQAGVAELAILDGGIAAWTASGGELSASAVQPQPATFEIASFDASLAADKKDVQAAIGSARIIDARTPEEYAGAQSYGEARGGRLPGAINIPWTSVFDEQGQLLKSGDLRTRMEAAGIGIDDEIIAYCTVGIRSAHLALALREAGFGKARNYAASFYEWAGDHSLPLE